MPMLEVLRADDRPLSADQKRAFAREATRIFHEVLGTPPGRLRLFFLDTPSEGLEGLYERPPAASDEQPDGGGEKKD
ncbi:MULTISPECIES: tautomerase family protein [Thermogemmatispora]|uniref:tautomerase family protein n=1 Tax=Thermogemmatispora TaxID=768669 RepID=UPI00069CAD96|nr:MULTISPECIES: hypothetical protein [Thermogemmatispora]